jgi:quaternary ammonium compound-resistance protein SugE
MSATLTPNLAWLLLAVAGLLEIVWSVRMKASHGFTKHHFTAITLVAAWVSFWLLGLAMRQLPVGTAYAVWTGIGAVGAAVLGILIFGESVTVALCAAFSASNSSAAKMRPDPSLHPTCVRLRLPPA